MSGGAKASFEGRAITDVIWIQTAFLGDVVLSTAAMGALTRRFPGTRQHLVTTPIGARALEGHPWLATIHAFDKRHHGGLVQLYKLARSLRQDCLARESTLVLRPHLSSRSALLAGMIGAHVTTFEEAFASSLSRCRVPRVALLHEAHRVGLLLEPLGLTREEIVAARPWLPPFPWERVDSPWAKALDEMARRASHLIAIAPGSVWGTKRWPADSYAALARALLEKTSSALVLLGGADEVEATGHIARALDFAADRVLDLGGKTSLAELRAIYPRLSLLVSNDSSAVHYATAFGVRTVAVFGATVPAMGFGPLAEGSLALGVEDLACRPCGAHGPAVCPLGHFRCMRELSVERVLEGCLKGYFVP